MVSKGLAKATEWWRVGVRWGGGEGRGCVGQVGWLVGEGAGLVGEGCGCVGGGR